jgi:S1-C subfamily serine protease
VAIDLRFERTILHSMKLVTLGLVALMVLVATAQATNPAKTEGLADLYDKAGKGDATAQFDLGNRYEKGLGVGVDMRVAAQWYRKSAEKGYSPALMAVGLMYYFGKGVVLDQIEALAWFEVCAESGDQQAIVTGSILAARLGPQMALVAKQRKQEILAKISTIEPGATGEIPTSPAQSDSGPTPKSSGSGSIVTSSGYILTAAHVVANAKSVAVISIQGTETATVVRVDESNDLAVLKIAGDLYSALPVAPSRRTRLGQVVATIGFPNIGIQGFSPKLTRGEISSLNGAGDDPRSWQISVPVQPGNSGGPLLDENGNLIGVVLAKLGLEAAKATGDLPQNVGYAVKSAYALALLEPYLDRSAPEPHHPNRNVSFEDMVAKAQLSAVLILVY